MANTFEFVGKLLAIKESDKFKPFETRKVGNDWTSTSLKFNVIAGDNRHMLEVKSLHKTDGTGRIFTLAKSVVDEDGKKEKGVSLEIDWNKRNNPDIIAQVAEFKKFVVDLEEPKRRNELEKALTSYKEGSITEEKLKELNTENVELALEESKKKRREFISEYDFAEYLNKLLASDKYKDRMFKIYGDIKYEYSDKSKKFYKKLIPTRIYLAEKEAEPSSVGNIVFYFKRDCLQEKEGKIIVNGYLRTYIRKGEELSAPVELIIDCSKDNIDTKRAELNNLLKESFKDFAPDSNQYKERSLKVKLLNGSQKMEITQDMLTEEQKKLLELDAITLDDVRRDLGGDVQGDFIEGMVFMAVGNTKGAKYSLYTDDDFKVKELEIKESVEDVKKEDIKKDKKTKDKDVKEDEEDDIF